MSQDWPSPQRPAQPPLPSTDDLPLAGEGYDRASVDDAFAAFYRHIAQLDATLRTLEALESFRLQAGELRADLRAIRSAGWSPYPRGYAPPAGAALSLGIPEALPRLALEVLFLVIVAVVVAVGSFGSGEIVGIMAAAVSLTALVEWVASRDRRPAATPAPGPASIPAAPPTAPAVIEAVPASDGAGWAAFAEVSELDAKSMLGALAPEPEPVPAETTEEFGEPELEAEPEPEEVRNSELQAPVPEPAPAPEPAAAPEPQEVRNSELQALVNEPEPEPEVLAEPSLEYDLDPWERGFDYEPDELDGDADEAPLPA